MSITAFSVLACLIAEQGLQPTRVGTLALGLAAADDVLAWCMLAVPLAAAHKGPLRVVQAGSA
jgi:Kef-type K+ transport system membrane component KefB